MKKNKNNKGFTLVELIVVMAVLAIISAIAVPRFLGVQKQAKIDADYATGAMIAKAAELYEAKGGDKVGLTGQGLIDSGYLSSIEFKSDDFASYKPENISILFDEGKITVTAKIGEGDTDTLYPRPVEPATP